MKAILVLSLMIGSIAKADMAGDLLKATDLSRGGVQGGLTWKAKIETSDDEETSSREFLVKAKDENALVESTAPARTKGELFLFNDRNMWFFKPSLKKPVSISPRQKLSGQAANGDIASTRYAKDYDATLEKTVTRGADKIHVLLLKAKAPNLTYDQIRYYVNGTTKLAEKAEFMTLQGQAFKIGEMEYKNSISVGGKKIPFVSKLTIVDAKFAKNKSVITYEDPKIETHAASIFNINNLSR